MQKVVGSFVKCVEEHFCSQVVLKSMGFGVADLGLNPGSVTFWLLFFCKSFIPSNSVSSALKGRHTTCFRLNVMAKCNVGALDMEQALNIWIFSSVSQFPLEPVPHSSSLGQFRNLSSSDGFLCFIWCPCHE